MGKMSRFLSTNIMLPVRKFCRNLLMVSSEVCCTPKDFLKKFPSIFSKDLAPFKIELHLLLQIKSK